MTQLTEEQFNAVEFIQNPFTDNTSWNGTMFETYGEEYEFVRQHIDLNKVWTWLDVDYGSAVLAGHHFVNRLGYFISEEPWTDINTEFYMADEFECARCNIEMIREDNICDKCDEKDGVCITCCTDEDHKDSITFECLSCGTYWEDQTAALMHETYPDRQACGSCAVFDSVEEIV